MDDSSSLAKRGVPGFLSLGFDLVDMERFGRALERHPRLVERVFTPAEIAYCQSHKRPLRHFAARFAAKEAVGKMLGLGVWAWQEIEIVAPRELLSPLGQVMGVAHGRPSGRPTVSLRGYTAEVARRLGIREIAVSLSHSDHVAGACVGAFLATEANG